MLYSYKQSVYARKPRIGDYWYDLNKVGLENRDLALGIICIGKYYGWYVALDTQISHGARYAIVFEGVYFAIGTETFFGSYVAAKDSYEVE